MSAHDDDGWCIERHTVYTAGIFDPECGHHSSRLDACNAIAWHIMLRHPRYGSSDAVTTDRFSQVLDRLTGFIAFVDSRRQAPEAPND